MRRGTAAALVLLAACLVLTGEEHMLTAFAGDKDSDSADALLLGKKLYAFTNLAGLQGGEGNADGVGSGARFKTPTAVAVDNAGNVYVSDALIHAIRKVTPAGVVTTLAGSAGKPGATDGVGAAARFNHPDGVAADGAGNVYVADTVNHTIRKITPDGTTTTLAGSPGNPGYQDGMGSNARFAYPERLAIDSAGNLYVADNAGIVRKVTPTGEVTTLAGGPGNGLIFNDPLGLAVDPAGNVYLADTYHAVIRKISPEGAVSTLTNSAGAVVTFNVPTDVALDTAGNLYVTETFGPLIWKITPQGAVTTLAGSGGLIGSTDGTGNNARFKEPWAVETDDAGNLFVADGGNHTIRKITPAGVVTTLAGSAGGWDQTDNRGFTDGLGDAARFNWPYGVAADSAGNVFVSDGENVLRKVTAGGEVTTLLAVAGGVLQFADPRGVALDSAGNLYVPAFGDQTIWKVTPAGEATILAGLSGVGGAVDGSGSAARFNGPSGTAVDSAGNVYVADSSNHAIRKVTPEGVVTTLAGWQAPFYGSADGTGIAARFYGPSGVAVDAAGNVYVADTQNCTIRKVTSEGVVTTLAGKAREPGAIDGTGNAARFYYPNGVAVDGAGNVYVADSGNSAIRKIAPSGEVTTLAGLTYGATGDASLYYPTSVALDGAGNVYVADFYNSVIRKVTPAGEVTTLAGRLPKLSSSDGTGLEARFKGPQAVVVDPTGNVHVADTGNGLIRKVTPEGKVTTLICISQETGGYVGFGWPCGLAMDKAGTLYVADYGGDAIRKVTSTGVVITLAGGELGHADGVGTNASFSSPTGVAVDDTGNVYVADSGNSTIRKVTPGGVVSTLAGNTFDWGSTDGTGGGVSFNQPFGVAVDSAGNVYVSDSGNHTIRKVTAQGDVTTVAGLAGIAGSADGRGSEARFNGPRGLALDASGNLFVADTGNNAIRLVSLGGSVTTIAGTAGIIGGGDDIGSKAYFSSPSGVALDSVGNLYVADTGNNRITKGRLVYGPIITFQPERQAVVAGAAVGLSFTVAGDGPLSYQWLRDGTNLVGATVSTFNITSPLTSDTGLYSLVVGNAYGSITSAPTFLLVATSIIQPPLPTAPEQIRTQGFGFDIALEVGRNFRIQYSTDLLHWIDLTNFTASGPALQFLDRAAINDTHRFYRVVSP